MSQVPVIKSLEMNGRASALYREQAELGTATLHPIPVHGRIHNREVAAPGEPAFPVLFHGPGTRIAIKVKGRILFIDAAEIRAIQAEGNYVSLHHESGSYLLRESISVIAGKLKPFGFVRIHRSLLINASGVEEIQPCSTGEYVVRLKGGRRCTVTRTYKKNLKSLADVWIGADPFLAE